MDSLPGYHGNRSQWDDARAPLISIVTSYLCYKLMTQATVAMSTNHVCWDLSSDAFVTSLIVYYLITHLYLDVGTSCNDTRRGPDTIRSNVEDDISHTMRDSIYFSHTHWFPLWDVYIGISPYRTLAVDWTAIYGSYVICNLIVLENTNVVHFSNVV